MDESAKPAPRDTILLAEDDDAVRSMLREMLEWNGCEVLEARDTDSALAISGQHAGAIHLLLTDLMLPGPGGQVLASLILEARPATKVLFMSGYPREMAFESYPQGEGISFLQKPFKPDLLWQKVRETIDSKRSTTP